MRALLSAIALTALAVAGAAQAACRTDRVVFRTGQGDVGFSVEVASTGQARAKGLMDRRHLDPGRGMLFVFPEPIEARFWMKDTRIPLDMVFVGPRGTVRQVKAAAKPMDETIIDGGPGIRFVLEINAGLAARHGIRPGVAMQSPLVPQDHAAWRCDAP